MDIVLKVILAVLVFLAVSSGITKIMLMPRDVEFFGAYGFSDPILVAYGAAHVVGGVMLIIRRTRFTGAVIVAITFAISAVVLVMAGKIMVAIVTVVAIVLLGVIVRHRSRRSTLASLRHELSAPCSTLHAGGPAPGPAAPLRL